TINDTENPVIGPCPANIVASTDAGQCSKTNVTWTNPSATDNCPGPSVACLPPGGTAFQKGTTTVTCTATDGSGNTSACTFTVTINDIELPAITCPADIVTNTAPGACTQLLSFEATATDNCPGVSVSCIPTNGETVQSA